MHGILHPPSESAPAHATHAVHDRIDGAHLLMHAVLTYIDFYTLPKTFLPQFLGDCALPVHPKHSHLPPSSAPFPSVNALNNTWFARCTASAAPCSGAAGKLIYFLCKPPSLTRCMCMIPRAEMVPPSHPCKSFPSAHREPHLMMYV